MNDWIEFIGRNVPSSKNNRQLVGKRIIKNKLCQEYTKWVEPLFIAQKDEWEKMKQEHTERPLMVGMYFYRDSKRRFDFNNVSQILCDMMTANNYIEDDNINEMIPVYLGHEVVKKEQSGVKLSVVNMEIWKDIPDYPKYQVSNMGNVRTLDYRHTGEIKIRKLSTDEYGYKRVTLYKNGKMSNLQVHRLVWMVFNGEIPVGIQINHINEDKTDNRLENLNLMTPKENINWGTGLKRRTKSRSKSVLQFTLDGELIKEWQSAKEASRNGYSQGAITHCCKGDAHWKTHKGYVWKYKG